MYNYEFNWPWESNFHAQPITASERKELMSNRFYSGLIKVFSVLNYIMADAEPKRRVRNIKRIRRERNRSKRCGICKTELSAQ